MDREVIFYHKGKLQIAQSIISDICKLYPEKKTMQTELSTAYYAINRAMFALDVEAEKASISRKSKRSIKIKHLISKVH